MSHIRKFESFRRGKKREEIIQEAVLQVNDIYKVKSTIDIPQSLINAYVKKVKDNTGKNLRQFFGDMDIAEEIVKVVTQNGLDSDKISATALVGGQEQPQDQAQVQTQVETQPQAQTQPQTQTQGQGEFEDVQGQEETQGETQAQPQTQGETQAQPQTQEQAQTQGQVEEEEEEEGGEEELPA